MLFKFLAASHIKLIIDEVVPIVLNLSRNGVETFSTLIHGHTETTLL